jgi:hypothetical protein
VKAATFDVPEFLQPVRDLARSFGAAIVGDEQLQREVVPLLEQKDDEVRSQLDVQPEGTILEVLLASLHEGKAKHVLVKDIATSTNALLRMRGEILEYSPVEIGHRLTGLGLVRTTLSSGRGIRLCRAVSRIVHSLATRYGIPKPKSKKDCPDCQLSPQDLD